MPFWKLCQFGNVVSCFIRSSSADVKIQPKAREYLFKIRHFNNFPLVSLSPHPGSRRGAERVRQGEARWIRLPKTALERSDLTEKFQFRESHTEAETEKTPGQIPVLSKARIVMYVDVLGSDL